MATHSSIPAWKISWTEDPDRLQSGYSHGGQKESDSTNTFTSSDKGVFSKYIKKSYSSIAKKGVKTNLILKWVEELNRHSSKENIQMPNSYLYIDSALLIKRKMKIKTIMRDHLTTVRVIITRQTCDNKC